ncbi:MAG: DNA polymerase III subunit delta [Coriobacteriia bacterium]|nr:DNA polymerase III subunit delta [Coriobacteriia bacterium]
MSNSANTSATSGQALLPAYLVVGEDELKRTTVVEKLRKRIADTGDLEFNHDVFPAEEAEGSVIVAACNTMPFAADVRLVEVNDADRLRKADSEALVEYLKDPSPTSVLCLVATKLAKNTRLYKAVAAVDKKSVIACDLKKKAELPAMVRQMAVTHGVTFSDRAAQKLLELVGENTVRLDAEIRKIALAHDSHDMVSDREVESMVVRVAEPKPWDLVDAMAARNLNRCLEVLGYMKGASPHSLLPLCMKRIRELVCARTMLDRGEQALIAGALGLNGKRAWLVKDYVANAKRFTSAELRAIVVAARDTEQAMKSGTDPHAAFLDWLLLVCGPQRRR